MKNTDAANRGAGEGPHVDQVIHRLAVALEAQYRTPWMQQMGIKPETMRTWRKRGEVPMSRIRWAAQRTGRTMDWFLENRDVDLSLPAAKNFAATEKQVSRTGAAPDLHLVRSGGNEDMQLLGSVATMVLEIVEARGLKLPPKTVGQLIELIYEHEVAHPVTNERGGVQRTAERFLRLVTAGS